MKTMYGNNQDFLMPIDNAVYVAREILEVDRESPEVKFREYCLEASGWVLSGRALRVRRDGSVTCDEE